MVPTAAVTQPHPAISSVVIPGQAAHPASSGITQPPRDLRLTVKQVYRNRPSLNLSPVGHAGLSGSAGVIFPVRAMAGCRAVAGLAGFHGPRWWLLPCRRGGSGWSAGREGLQAGDRGGDLAGPGPVPGEPQPQAAAAAGRRPATENRRSRSRFGSQRRAWPARASSWVQASSSLARATISHHSWFWANPFSGRLRSPVSLAQRTRSSQRARRRCRSSRSASWPFLASVANAVDRWPSMSVKRVAPRGAGALCGR